MAQIHAHCTYTFAYISNMHPNVLCGAGGGEDGGVVAATTPPLDGRRYRAVHFHSRGFAAPVRQRSWDRRAKATDAVDVT